MGRDGRDHVTRLLDPEAILARIVALYDRLLEEKGLGSPVPVES